MNKQDKEKLKRFTKYFIILIIFFLIILVVNNNKKVYNLIIKLKGKIELKEKKINNQDNKTIKKIVKKTKSVNIIKSDKKLMIMKFNKENEKEKKRLKMLISEWIYNNYYRVYKKLADELSDYFVEKSQIPLLMLSLVAVESSFITQNISSANARGLGQIKYNIWVKEDKEKMLEYGITSPQELFDPIKNLKMSEYILLKYYKECNNNIQNALIKYNTGKCELSIKKDYKTRIGVKNYLNKIFSICGKVYVYLNLKN